MDDSAADGRVRLALANSDEITLEGLRVVLARHRDQVKTVDAVSVTRSSIAAAAGVEADVMLLDVGLEDGGWRELAGELVAEKPPYRLVVYTDVADDRRLLEALRLGVAGYLLKSLSGLRLVDHIVRAHRGQVVVDPTLGIRLAMAAASEGEPWPDLHPVLSPRQKDVLRLLVDGLGNRAIAHRLGLGEETVKTHLRVIYRRLGVSDRTRAVSAARRWHILS